VLSVSAGIINRFAARFSCGVRVGQSVKVRMCCNESSITWGDADGSWISSRTVVGRIVWFDVPNGNVCCPKEINGNVGREFEKLASWYSRRVLYRSMAISEIEITKVDIGVTMGLVRAVTGRAG
jgi:hypothetical protein